MEVTSDQQLFKWCRKFIDGGLLILSRYPITETRKRIYAKGTSLLSWLY
jgi:hypothetical protein